MSQENVEIVRQVYDAVARRDADAVLALYDPKVEWDFSRNPLGGLVGGGVYHGHEGLRRWFRQWHEAWKSVDTDCVDLIDAGDHIVSVVTVRGHGRASGVELEWRDAFIWTIREGKVVRVVSFLTRAEALEAAGLSG